MVDILVTGNSVDESSNNFIEFIVTLSAASLDVVTVNYRTLLSGTAIDADLSGSSTSNSFNGLVTFAPGELTKSIFIRAGSDTLDERDEHITLELYNPTGADLSGGAPVLRSTGVILDNDGAGSNLALFTSDPVIVEGDSGQKLAVFEIRLSQPATTAFTASYTTADGTAIAGQDYTATSGVVNFSVGQEVATVSVAILGDTTAEAAEVFSLIVTPPGTPSIGGQGAVGEATILDTDTAVGPEISIEGDAVGESSNNFLRFVVTLSEPSVDAVTVNYRTLLAGTAVDADLSSSSTGTSNNSFVTFAPGETSHSIFIRAGNDTLDEGDEHITVELFDPSGAVLSGGAPVLRSTGIILDNDGTGSNLALFTSDPVIVEGDAGQTLAVFEIRLSQPAPSAFTASYTTADGTAIAGQDYQATSGTVSFAAGQEIVAVSVPVFGDTTAEAAEVFSLIVTPPASPSINGDGAVGEATILDTDTDAGPEISIEGDAVEESSSNFLRFVVTLSEPSIDAVTVNYRTLLVGTAVDADLSSTSSSATNNSTITFAPGETTQSILVRSGNDTLDERDEHITVELFDPSGAAFAGGTPVLRSTGIILDNDGAGSNLALFTSDPVIIEGDAGQTLAVFEIRLSQPASSTFTASYTTADGTAIAGQDYQATSGTVSFAPGQEVVSVSVPIIGDTIAEAAEVFSLVVTPPGTPSIGGAGAVGEATILDTDTAMGPEISVEGNAVEESSNNFIRFVVTLSESSVNPVTVNYRTLLAGTAVDADMSSSSTSSGNNATITFAPGETTKSIFIRSGNDTLDERDEHITLELFDPTGGVFSGGTPLLRSTGIILDNDGAGPNLAMFTSDPVIIEGDAGQKLAVFEIRLSQPAPAGFTATYSTLDGTALAGEDYQATSGTVSFAAGQEVASVSVPVFGDTLAEAAEVFSLIVTPPSSPSIGTDGAVGEATIIDTDTAAGPEISIVGDAVEESSNNFLRFVVTLSESSLNPVTVDFSTKLGTAVDADLTSSSTSSTNNGTLTFAPGETSKSIFIRSGNDTLDERDESIFLELSNATGATFANNDVTLRATGFILDNDGAGLNIALAAPDQFIRESGGASSIETVLVELSQTSDTDLIFDVTTTDGLAVAGTDFQLVSNTITFVAGQTVAAVQVEVFGDTLTEGDEGFFLDFAPQAGSAFAGTIGTAQITIRNGPNFVGPTEMDDNLTGTENNDTIDLLGGNDTYNGLGGIDTVEGGSGNDTINGGADSDQLSGGADNDMLDGGTGADTMTGGLGNDQFFVDNAGDTVIEAAGEGTDFIFSTVSYTVAANTERLLLTGTANINATGRADQNDILFGNDGDNMLDGLGGIDTMIGGLGNDQYFVDNAADVVTESAGAGTDFIFSSISTTLAANTERLILTGMANIDATGLDGRNDILIGNTGDNILDGKSGVDTLIGGLGNDRYIIDNAADIVRENTGEGIGDYIFSSVSYTNAANAERLYLTGTEDINATGLDGQADLLVGNSGNNTLDGKSGRDIMQGGGGNDVYFVDQLTDVVTENAGEGTDFIFTTGSYQIAENAERLIAVEGANAVGLTARNFQNDIIIGNSGTNVFVDQFGRDIFVGGGGADFFRFIANLDPVNNVNRINDFDSTDDQFQLQQAIYSQIDVGILDASEFVLGTAAGDADDRIIYDSSVGKAYYDPDGTGAAAQIEIVNVTIGTVITADDFQIF